jgi:hypothetical protein
MRIHHGGYTEGDTSATFLANRSTALATVLHEAWHQYAGAGSEGMPPWVHEGMACYFESVQWEGGAPRFGGTTNTFRQNSLRNALEPGRWQPLHKLLDAKVAEWLAKSDTAATFGYYAQLWSLMVFLQRGEGMKHLPNFEMMMHDFASGRVSSKVNAWRVTEGAGVEVGDGVAVFQAYFGADLSRFDAELRQFAMRQCGLPEA